MPTVNRSRCKLPSLEDSNKCQKHAKVKREKNVILNEVKNLCSWLTYCYDAILHFVQNVPMKFNQCVCFACGRNDMGEVEDEGQKACLSLRDPKDCIKQAKNDKPGEHPPTPFKGGTFGHNSPPIPLLWRGQGVVGRGMFLLFVISSPGHVINPLQKRVMTNRSPSLRDPKDCLKQAKMTKKMSF